MGNTSQSYRASPAVCDHTVLRAARPTQVNTLRLNPSQSGHTTRFNYIRSVCF